MKRDCSGQSIVEMMFIFPAFIILAAICVSVAYMSWQGIKVQQAANVAARMAGQEVVNGASTFGQVMEDNGLLTEMGAKAVGDHDPSECMDLTEEAQKTCLNRILEETSKNNGGKLPGNAGKKGTMYWGYRRMVYDMFGKGEQAHLYVPPPVVRHGTVQVTVARIMKVPKMMNWDPAPVLVIGRAYGGEETYMYGLPRFGTVGNGTKFWQEKLKEIQKNAGNGE